MATFLEKKANLIDWVDTSIAKKALLNSPKEYFGIRETTDPMEQADYDEALLTAQITVKVNGTRFEGRPTRIENVKKGHSILLERDKNNAYDANCISVLNANKESLGNLSAALAAILSPLLDSHEATLADALVELVTPSSQLEDKRKSPVLYISFKVKLQNPPPPPNTKCIICHISGDQTKIWAQTINVLYCSLPAADAKLLFEFYNREMGEYADNSLRNHSAGLDNLMPEIEQAQKKMRQEMDPLVDYTLASKKILLAEKTRYEKILSILNQRDPSDDHWLLSAFEPYILETKSYHWLDETHVSHTVWDAETSNGFFNFYEVLELFDGNQLPVDLCDEDVISVFGTKKFAALADLSYDC